MKNILAGLVFISVGIMGYLAYKTEKSKTKGDNKKMPVPSASPGIKPSTLNEIKTGV